MTHKSTLVRSLRPSLWSQKQEVVKSKRPIRFLFCLVRFLPFPVLSIGTFPVSFFYYICSKKARVESLRFLRQRCTFAQLSRPRWTAVFLHIHSFAACVVEKVAAWCGKCSLQDIDFFDDAVVELKQGLEARQGAFLLGSHLGNMELLRCLAAYSQTGVRRDVPVVAIMDMKATAFFNDTVREMNPRAGLHVINSADIGPETIETLQDVLACGGLVVVGADRTSAVTSDRSLSEPFLGKTARYPYGAFLLAALLQAPVYSVFALRKRTVMLHPRYEMHVDKLSAAFSGMRVERQPFIEGLCREFVSRLEAFCLQFPYQWYNFYDYWFQDGASHVADG